VLDPFGAISNVGAVPSGGAAQCGRQFKHGKSSLHLVLVAG
jgi:hypothetical protein